MSDALDRLTAEVEETRSANDSIITLLGNIKSMLDAAGTDQEKLNELANLLDTEQSRIADAVVANTPAEPTDPVEP